MSGLLAKDPRDRVGYAEDVARELARLLPRGARTREASAPAYLYRPHFVGRETALAAWRRAVERGDLDEGLALLRAVRKRVAAGGVPTDERRYARVYTALLRDGFDRDAIEAALDRSVGRPAERNEP